MSTCSSKVLPSCRVDRGRGEDRRAPALYRRVAGVANAGARTGARSRYGWSRGGRRCGSLPRLHETCYPSATRLAGPDATPPALHPAAPEGAAVATRSEVRTTMRFCVIGNGAMGVAHLKALANIPGVEVTALASRVMESTAEVAKKYNVPYWTTDFDAAITRNDVDAVILTSPTQVHADQAEACLKAGKHVLIEIPMADSIADAERIVRLQKETGLTAMAGHVRPFDPGHQWVHKKIAAGELHLQGRSRRTLTSSAART